MFGYSLLERVWTILLHCPHYNPEIQESSFPDLNQLCYLNGAGNLFSIPFLDFPLPFIYYYFFFCLLTKQHLFPGELKSRELGEPCGSSLCHFNAVVAGGVLSSMKYMGGESRMHGKDLPQPGCTKLWSPIAIALPHVECNGRNPWMWVKASIKPIKLRESVGFFSEFLIWMRSHILQRCVAVWLMVNPSQPFPALPIDWNAQPHISPAMKGAAKEGCSFASHPEGIWKICN